MTNYFQNVLSLLTSILLNASFMHPQNKVHNNEQAGVIEKDGDKFKLILPSGESFLAERVLEQSGKVYYRITDHAFTTGATSMSLNDALACKEIEITFGLSNWGNKSVFLNFWRPNMKANTTSIVCCTKGIGEAYPYAQNEDGTPNVSNPFPRFKAAAFLAHWFFDLNLERPTKWNALQKLDVSWIVWLMLNPMVCIRDAANRPEFDSRIVDFHVKKHQLTVMNKPIDENFWACLRKYYVTKIQALVRGHLSRLQWAIKHVKKVVQENFARQNNIEATSNPRPTLKQLLDMVVESPKQRELGKMHTQATSLKKGGMFKDLASFIEGMDLLSPEELERLVISGDPIVLAKLRKMIDIKKQSDPKFKAFVDRRKKHEKIESGLINIVEQLKKAEKSGDKVRIEKLSSTIKKKKADIAKSLIKLKELENEATEGELFQKLKEIESFIEDHFRCYVETFQTFMRPQNGLKAKSSGMEFEKTVAQQLQTLLGPEFKVYDGSELFMKCENGVLIAQNGKVKKPTGNGGHDLDIIVTWKKHVLMIIEVKKTPNDVKKGFSQLLLRHSIGELGKTESSLEAQERHTFLRQCGHWPKKTKKVEHVPTSAVIKTVIHGQKTKAKKKVYGEEFVVDSDNVSYGVIVGNYSDASLNGRAFRGVPSTIEQQLMLSIHSIASNDYKQKQIHALFNLAEKSYPDILTGYPVYLLN